ncbi:MAG: hypothetical protein HYS09_01520 [Chloroflexi bacterium]|nr:hypothetical protein [Chloroflexota bacterium]
MKRAPVRCPRCRQSLIISCDMWGQFYACEGCGFSAEDDDHIKEPETAYGALFLEHLRAQAARRGAERREIA